MTIATCLVCGCRKFGALGTCPGCLWKPYLDEDLIDSIILSDNHLKESALSDIGAALKNGQDFTLPADLLGKLKSDYSRALPEFRKHLPPELPLSDDPSVRTPQQTIQRQFRLLVSREHTRQRYRSTLTNPGEMPVDDVQYRLLESLDRLVRSSDATCPPYFMRLLPLPFAPVVALMAAAGLGLRSPEPSWDKAVLTIGAFPDPERQDAVEGVRRLAASATEQSRYWLQAYEALRQAFPSDATGQPSP